jgi:hypothetical protein
MPAMHNGSSLQLFEIGLQFYEARASLKQGAKASGRISIAWPVEILCASNGNH